MAKEFLSVVRFAVVASLPGTAAQGDACVLSSNGHLYVYDGSGWVDHGATGGGGGTTRGTAVVDFGASPEDRASVAVTGQGAIGAGSVVRAWIDPTQGATALHSVEEHTMAAAAFAVTVRTIVPGTGFTIEVTSDRVQARGTFNLRWEWT